MLFQLFFHLWLGHREGSGEQSRVGAAPDQPAAAIVDCVSAWCNAANRPDSSMADLPLRTTGITLWEGAKDSPDWPCQSVRKMEGEDLLILRLGEASEVTGRKSDAMGTTTRRRKQNASGEATLCRSNFSAGDSSSTVFVVRYTSDNGDAWSRTGTNRSGTLSGLPRPSVVWLFA